MSNLKEILESVYSVMHTMTPVDFLDIALLSYIIYVTLKLIRETRAGQLFKGISFLLVVYMIGKIIELKSITYILEHVFNIGILAILIMFQPEVRRAVEKLGHTGLGLDTILSASNREMTTKWSPAIQAICDSCVELSRTCTGALIVIEKQTKLGEQIENGTILNAVPSKELFGNIFYPKTPLHDGAVIMRDGMILAAACFLPKPQKEELINKKLGSRHRAAIGMSENSDAIVIVVSEETGQISIAENGDLTRDFDRNSLEQFLTDKLIPRQPENKKMRLTLRKNRSSPEESENPENLKHQEISENSENSGGENFEKTS
ncbi:MAG: diadenylate cyclase CdaA [Oscillospiraceae bacterium]|nr:diadenylate cyclase CdaA [Oscillospiraceae bacterium]